MIAKRIDLRDASKSRATRLAKYVTDELERVGRVADVFTANCISDDTLLAAKEIEICQAKNTRAKDDKTYHLLLSFPDGERPGKEQLRAMADTAAKALGYGEHQRIAVVHDDTDNMHMHLIINKIHPERLTIHTPRRDFKILAELCAKLEQDNSLKHTNHESTRSAAEAKAQDMEAHSGTESFLSYARKKATPLLDAARSWEALHATFAEVGISLRLKGNGLVMMDHTGAVAVKASTVARDFSKAKLEKRLGAFVPHDASRTMGNHFASPENVAEKPSSTYRKTPLPGTERLYQQYQREQESARQECKAQLTALWDEQKQITRRIAATAKLNLPKAASRGLKRELHLRARASADAAIADMRRTIAKKREGIKSRYRPLGYIEWLKREAERGNIPAIYALRRRGAVAPALINITACDLRNAKLIAAKIAHVTGRGTLFYRAGTDVFRDNGSHVSLKREVSDAGVEAALRIAMAKFNSQPLAVNGTEGFRTRCVEIAVKANLPITFSDIQMEQARQMRIRSKSPQPIEIIKDKDTPPTSRTERAKPSIPLKPPDRGASR